MGSQCKVKDLFFCKYLLPCGNCELKMKDAKRVNCECHQKKNMIYRMVFPGNPITKKNSSRILKNGRTGAAFIAPSANYTQYANKCLWYLRMCSGLPDPPINYPVNVKCVYYMETRRRVDLCNLLESTCDILTAARILEDDNSNIVAGHDGSRVLYDKERPRVEIEIRGIE